MNAGSFHKLQSSFCFKRNIPTVIVLINQKSTADTLGKVKLAKKRCGSSFLLSNNHPWSHWVRCENEFAPLTGFPLSFTNVQILLVQFTKKRKIKCIHSVRPQTHSLSERNGDACNNLRTFLHVAFCLMQLRAEWRQTGGFSTTVYLILHPSSTQNALSIHSVSLLSVAPPVFYQ